MFYTLQKPSSRIHQGESIYVDDSGSSPGLVAAFECSPQSEHEVGCLVSVSAQKDSKITQKQYAVLTACWRWVGVEEPLDDDDDTVMTMIMVMVNIVNNKYTMMIMRKNMLILMVSLIPKRTMASTKA